MVVCVGHIAGGLYCIQPPGSLVVVESFSFISVEHRASEAAEVEERTKQFEQGRAEREAKLQAELATKEAAEQSAADAEPLPEPK